MPSTPSTVTAVNRTNRTDRPTSEPARQARDRSGRRSDQNAAIGTPAMGRSTDSARHGHSRSLRGVVFPSSGSFAGSGEDVSTGSGFGAWMDATGSGFGTVVGVAISAGSGATGAAGSSFEDMDDA